MSPALENQELVGDLRDRAARGPADRRDVRLGAAVRRAPPTASADRPRGRSAARPRRAPSVPTASTTYTSGDGRVLIADRRPAGRGAGGRWRSASRRRPSRARRASDRRRRWRRAGPSASGVTSAGIVAVIGHPLADRLEVRRPVGATRQSGLIDCPGSGARRQRLHDTVGISPSVPTMNAVTVVLPPGGTSGGSALIASTRGPTTKLAGRSPSTACSPRRRAREREQPRESLHQKSPLMPMIGSSGRPLTGCGTV